MAKDKKIKALCLLSGGLDSRLACKIMQEQCNVEAVFFMLPFGAGCCSDKFCVFRFAQTNAFKLHIIDFTKGILFRKYLSIIKKPKHGYGTAINPCIDCHIFMLKEAKKLAKKIDADIIVTGEVLNERPMSQHAAALKVVESEAGLKGKLLRPLSAKLLEETDAEKAGLIAREKLLAISGRGRKEQIALAKKYKINFPSPAGGCLLCEKEFAAKLKCLFMLKRNITAKDIKFLRIGRYFVYDDCIIVVGRNQEENKELLKLAEKGKETILEAKGTPSPITIVSCKNKQKFEATIKKAAEITARYSDAESGDIEVNIMFEAGKLNKTISVKKATEHDIEKLRIK